MEPPPPPPEPPARKTFNRWWGLLLGSVSLIAVLAGLGYLGWRQYRQLRTQKLALSELRSLKAQSKDQQCVTQAQQFPGPKLSEFHLTSQDMLSECQLSHAQQLAKASRFEQAIQQASEIAPNAPVYGKSQRLTVEWSENILEIAQRKYVSATNQKGFKQAIEIAQAIPQGSSTHQRAQTIVQQWQQDEKENKALFEQAQKHLKDKQWTEARELGNQLLASPVDAWRKSARLILTAAAQGETPLDVRGQITSRSPLRSDKTPYVEHTFEGNRGQTAILTLESADFDPRLILIGPSKTELGQNNDGFEGSNDALMGIALPESGTYTVIVNGATKSAVGQYHLTVKTR